MDILSDLPEDVKGKVLSYLPIEEAVRTSLLSSKWRYTWTSHPELCHAEVIFNEDPRKVNYYRILEFVDGNDDPKKDDYPNKILEFVDGNDDPKKDDYYSSLKEFVDGRCRSKYTLKKVCHTMIVSTIQGKLEDARVCKMRGTMVNGEIRLEESPVLHFNQIKNIEFWINFDDENETAFVRALLERASHLQYLAVHVDSPSAKIWDSIDVAKRGVCEHLSMINILQFDLDRHVRKN